jgi:hypothetical protein
MKQGVVIRTGVYLVCDRGHYLGLVNTVMNLLVSSSLIVFNR